MPRAYSSDDLRKKLLEAHGAGKGTLHELAERFGVSVPWAWKVSAAHSRSGTTQRQPQSRHGRPSRVKPGCRGRLAEGQARPGVARVAGRTGAHHRHAHQPYADVARAGTRPAVEKKSLHAAERDTEENRRRRQAFVERLRSIEP